MTYILLISGFKKFQVFIHIVCPLEKIVQLLKYFIRTDKYTENRKSFYAEKH